MASSQRLEIIRRTYYDSVTLMLVAKELLKLEGISVATLNMGTEANYKIMGAGGFDLTGVDATPNDLVLALLSDAPEAEKVLDDALAKAKEYLANLIPEQRPALRRGIALRALGLTRLAVGSFVRAVQVDVRRVDDLRRLRCG